MEKRKDPPAAYHRGLMERLLRRRDPGGDEPFDPDDDAEEEE